MDAAPRVLVVDGNAMARGAMAHLLRRQGYRIVQAEDGPAALAHLGDAAVDAVLLEASLPGMTGLEVLGHIRAGDASAHVPVLMFAAMAHRDTLVRALELGASDCLVKPVTLPELLSRLDARLAPRCTETKEMPGAHRRTPAADRGEPAPSPDADLPNAHLLQQLIDSFPDLVTVKDRDGRYLITNAAFDARYGQGRGSVLGKTFSDLRPAGQDGRRAMAEADAQVLRTGAPLVLPEYLTTQADGTSNVLRIRKFPVLDDAGTVRGILTWTEDVTDMVRAREELERSERRFRQLAEGSLQGIVIHRNFRILYANRASAELVGYESPEAMLAELDSVLEMLHPHEHARMQDYAARRARGDAVPDVYDVRQLHRDGTPIWVNVMVQTVSWEGEPATQTTIVNIEARKRAEAALQESLERFQTYAESSADWFWEMDADLRFTYMSPSVERLVGVSPEWHYGKTRRDLLGENYDRATWAEHLRLLEERKPFRDFRFMRTGEGVEPRWLRTSGVPVFAPDGTFKGYRGSGSDITEQVRLEAARERNERVMAQAEEVAGLGAMAWTPATGEQHWSDGVFRILGEPPQAFVPDAEAFSGFLHPEDRARVLHALVEAANAQRGVDLTCRIVRKDGTVRYIHARGEMMLDQSLGESRLVGTLQDITERTRVEQQMRQLQKMDALGRLTAAVAHDFNNLLQVVGGYAGVARIQIENAGLPTEGLEGMQEVLQSIQDAIDDGGGLLRQLLAFGRQSSLDPLPLLVDSHLQSRLNMLQMAASKYVTVQFEPGASGAIILADPGSLDQVLLNLTVNAKDAMPKGGQLRIATEQVAPPHEVRMATAAAPSARFVRISVKDTGTGMPPEVAEHIFEPFFTTKGAQEGTGLGLATVHGIISQHGGHVAVRSTPGAGTTFVIHWPVVDDSELDAPPGQRLAP